MVDLPKFEVTDELKEKLLSCESAEDVLALAKEEGIELAEEQLAEIAAGGGTDIIEWIREQVRFDNK